MKIAIIEDDAAISQMYRIKFEADGYEVNTAENGQLGLELIEHMSPDIVLLDLMMPVMDGEEMLTKLREQTWGKNVKVIILTNMGESEAPDSIKEMNVISFILKANMTPRQVAEVVKQALEQ